MGTPFETQKSFLVATKGKNKKVLGSDFVMIIKGYEGLSFQIKTNGLPTIKNDESVEYNTIHGVKTVQEGRIQTLNEIQVTFNEDDAFTAKETIEGIILEDKNDELEIEFYAGRDIEEMKLWGTLTFASIHLADNAEADIEATTTPLSLSATLKGHYFPSEAKTENLKSSLGIA